MKKISSGMINNTFHFTVSGYTITEILVTVIVSSLVLLSVYEGFTIFTKTSFSLAVTIESSTQNIESYLTLERLYNRSDTISVSGEIIKLYQDGDHFATIRNRSGGIAVDINNMTNTVFYEGVRFTFPSDQTLPPVLAIPRANEDSIKIRFKIHKNQAGQQSDLLSELEEKYRHE